jgi:polyferredoxin
MVRQRIRIVVLAASGVLFPVSFYYFSPYLVLQTASEGIVSGSLIVFGTQFLSALVFGRAFCGWVCPAGAIGEATGGLRDRRFGRRALDFVKYGIWLPWVGLIVFLAVRAGGLTRVEPGYQTWHGISVSSIQSLVIFAAIVLLVVGLTLWAGRRGFCHTLCWMAPFLILGRAARDRLHWPGVRLKADTQACIACGACTRACAMSLDVQGMVKRGDMSDRECILCARCADGCPKHVISLRWRRGR